MEAKSINGYGSVHSDSEIAHFLYEKNSPKAIFLNYKIEDCNDLQDLDLPYVSIYTYNFHKIVHENVVLYYKKNNGKINKLAQHLFNINICGNVFIVGTKKDMIEIRNRAKYTTATSEVYIDYYKKFQNASVLDEYNDI